MRVPATPSPLTRRSRTITRAARRDEGRVHQPMPDGRPVPSRRNAPLATATAASTKLRPLGDRVVIKPTPREEMTKSGIVLPDTAKEKPQEGQILAVG